MALTEKQKSFCREYIKDYNATQAAIRAGYSKKTASEQASRLLKKNDLLAMIKDYQKEQLRQSCLSRERIISDLFELLNRCMKAVPVKEWDYEKHEFVEKGEYRFDAKGALEAIKLLGKHLEMFEETEEKQAQHDSSFMEALNNKANAAWGDKDKHEKK
ncbi:MAG: terminase small subunit [Clostridiales bacterium]|nr:terminase small subunit [Clostridiales bacterium]